MTTTVKALVLTGYGLNCDIETAHAFEMAGAIADRVHINALIDGSTPLDDYQILAFIGGFSWGDDHGGGVVQAVRMKTNIGDQILSFLEKGKAMIGICNGFQCLVNLGLLPGIDGRYTDRRVALTYNDCGNFRNDWVHLKINADSPCVFTRGMDRLELPIRHGEGKFVTDQATLQALADNHQVTLQYALPDGRPAGGAFPNNPNGSMLDIAGICDATGRVFGLMPHPEAFSHWTSHPNWPHTKERVRRGLASDPEATATPGIHMFQNAVSYFS